MSVNYQKTAVMLKGVGNMAIATPVIINSKNTVMAQTNAIQRNTSNSPTVGVLALQGAVSEHTKKLHQAGCKNVIEVKYAKELNALDGLIIPGGESTAIGHIIKEFGLIKHLVKRINEGMPVWGTCAGMILLAKNIVNDDRRHLCVMDITVERNAYGRQLESFTTAVKIPEVSTSPIPLTFIRAPYIVEASPLINILLSLEGKIVACRQHNMLATSFHPELTDDISFHRYFLSMVAEHNSIIS